MSNRTEHCQRHVGLIAYALLLLCDSVPSDLVFSGRFAGKSTSQMSLLNTTVSQLAKAVNSVLTIAYRVSGRKLISRPFRSDTFSPFATGHLREQRGRICGTAAAAHLPPGGDGRGFGFVHRRPRSNRDRHALGAARHRSKQRRYRRGRGGGQEARRGEKEGGGQQERPCPERQYYFARDQTDGASAAQKGHDQQCSINVLRESVLF